MRSGSKLIRKYFRSAYKPSSHSHHSSQTLESKRKSFSPEDDPHDKSIQWEDIPRADIYKLLKHVDDARSLGYDNYLNSYVQVDSELTEADLPFLQHIQENPREIANESDDEAGYRMVNNRNMRLNAKDKLSFEDWVKTLNPAEYAGKEEMLEEARAKLKAEEEEKKRRSQLRHPPQVDPRQYRGILFNAKDPILDDLYPDADTPYSFEDWEYELRRNYMLREIGEEQLPALAEKALIHKYKSEQPSPVWSQDMMLTKYAKLEKDDLKPIKEYHQRMLRMYGSHYELGETYTLPEVLSAETKEKISSSILLASMWDDQRSTLSLALPQSSSSSTSGSSSSSASSSDSEHDVDSDELPQELQYIDDLETDFADEEEVQARLEALRRARTREREKKRQAKLDKESVKKYSKLLDRLMLPKTRDLDVMEPDDMDSLFFKENNDLEQNEDDEHTDSDLEFDDNGNPIPSKDRLDQMPEGLKMQMYEHINTAAMDDDLNTIDNKYKHLDTYEKSLLEQLDPMMKSQIAKLCPKPLEGPRVFHVDSEVKEAIYRLNRVSPTKYHSHLLAQMFGLSLKRTQAILKLQWMEEQILKEQGIAPEDMVRECEVEEYFKPDKAQWDPEYFENLTSQGEAAYVDEGDLAIMRAIEKQRVSKFWNMRERMILKEKAMASLKGAYGAPEPALPAPQVLSDKVQRPSRHTVVLTNIGDLKNSNFRIAVRCACLTISFSCLESFGMCVCVCMLPTF